MHWDWGDMMFLFSALLGLGVTLFMLGFDMADHGSPASLDEMQAAPRQPEPEVQPYRKAA